MWLSDAVGVRPMRTPRWVALCRPVFTVLIVALALSAAVVPFTAVPAQAVEEQEAGFPPLAETDPEAFAAFLLETGGVHAADLAAALPDPEPAAVAEVAAAPAAPVYTVGQNIAGFALQFVGYPYVWAGNTPAGFDCSGFTQYVILNTLGIDIGHGTPGQAGFGYWVDYGAWMPGDLIFFANTFGPGISHVGVYIGDGQMVHAGSEETGVHISSVYSEYYSAHYYGATRLA
ncbi:MAG TPA: C40 family peptidase [Thermomicrobiales bacterium]|nr:C40 family peptidase [Thermomicrobiales bacterium]